MAFNDIGASLEQALREGDPANSGELLRMAGKALAGDPSSIDPGIWHLYLDVTRKPDWLRNLGGREMQYTWAETAFRIIETSGYTLETLFSQRVREHPDHPFLQEMLSDTMHAWSYKAAYKNIRSIAAVLLSAAPGGRPRVGIISANTPESAFCDLACLASSSWFR